jgi:hypothetical protein
MAINMVNSVEELMKKLKISGYPDRWNLFNERLKESFVGYGGIYPGREYILELHEKYRLFDNTLDEVLDAAEKLKSFPELMQYILLLDLVGLIEIGRFIQRIESSVTIAFFAVGFVKTTVCVIAALRGMQHIFRLDHYRSVTAPFCLLFIVLCENLFKNLAEVIEFINFYYPFIAVPFQLFLPVSLWIGAEVKHRKKNASENPAQPPPMPPYTETSS